jgi:hypothetical protein
MRRCCRRPAGISWTWPLPTDKALEAGWPIATGVIEGACRHRIADRLSVSGARWGLDGAEAILLVTAAVVRCNQIPDCPRCGLLASSQAEAGDRASRTSGSGGCTVDLLVARGEH